MVMTAQQMIDLVLSIDSRFNVEEVTYESDAGRLVYAVKTSLTHAVHGELSNICAISEGAMVKFWAEQKAYMLDQTVEEQIRESAEQMNMPYERVLEYVNSKK